MLPGVLVHAVVLLLHLLTPGEKRLQVLVLAPLHQRPQQVCRQGRRRYEKKKKEEEEEEEEKKKKKK